MPLLGQLCAVRSRMDHLPAKVELRLAWLHKLDAPKRRREEAPPHCERHAEAVSNDAEKQTMEWP